MRVIRMGGWNWDEIIKENKPYTMPEDELVDALFCDRESKCEKTLELSDIESATITNAYFKSEVKFKGQELKCDDVCELLGEPTWKIRVQTFMNLNIIPRIRKVIWFIKRPQYVHIPARRPDENWYLWTYYIKIFGRSIPFWTKLEPSGY